MKAKLIRIGNSRGIRIPKPLLEHSNLAEEVEIEAQENQIIIRSARQPREGWADAFRQMAERGDDKRLDEYTPTKWDETEWEW